MCHFFNFASFWWHLWSTVVSLKSRTATWNLFINHMLSWVFNSSKFSIWYNSQDEVKVVKQSHLRYEFVLKQSHFRCEFVQCLVFIFGMICFAFNIFYQSLKESAKIITYLMEPQWVSSFFLSLFFWKVAKCNI